MAATPTQASIDLPNKAYLLPDAIPMWPPVWWTWPILAVIFLFIIGFVFYKYKAYKKQAYRREAVAFIANIKDEHSDKECILMCHEIIRRCLISEGKALSAALPSRSLFEEIDTKTPAKHSFLALGDDFLNGQYRSQIELTQEKRKLILSTTLQWIRKHHA